MPSGGRTNGTSSGSGSGEGWTPCGALTHMALQHHARIRGFVNLWLLLCLFTQILIGFGSRLGLYNWSLRRDRPPGFLILSREWKLNGLIGIEVNLFDTVVGNLSPVCPESSKAIDRRDEVFSAPAAAGREMVTETYPRDSTGSKLGTVLPNGVPEAGR